MPSKRKLACMTGVEGFVYDDVFGGRVFMLSAKTCREMVRLLAESMSKPAADALMWNIGMRYGMALGRRAAVISRSADEQIRSLALSALKAGWGVPQVTNNLATTGTVEVVMNSCVFCDGLMGEDSPHCFFLSGVLNGIAETIFNTSFRTIETECSAMGAKACKFNITKI
uniref:4-vinyl reductase 4VR domain-containing protein n=1 Tax=Caldiarchaeum subterraneum TaxID=311458 RepID=A0A7C5Q848_CALS0